MSSKYSKEKLVQAYKEVWRALAKSPTKREFIRDARIDGRAVSERAISVCFGGRFASLAAAAGSEPNNQKQKIQDEDLLTEWGNIVRKLGHVPTVAEFHGLSRFSPDVLQRRFGGFTRVPQRFMEECGESPDWADIRQTVSNSVRSNRMPPDREVEGDLANPARAKPDRLPDRPTYGSPIDFRGLRHEPINEDGVIFLFGMVARELGFLVESVQGGFPDCEAKQEVGKQKWQRVRIEFEFESRNFRDHGHDPKGCDIIVCWRHNWKEAPLQVIELVREIERLPNPKK